MSVKREFLWLVGLIGVLVTEAWAIHEPKPDSVAAWLAALVAFVGIEHVGRRVARASATAHPNDPPLMRKLLEELPPHAMQFFREHDFLGTCRQDEVRPLWNFVNRWGAPDHLFQDTQLEAARSELLRAGLKTAASIAAKTRRLGTDLLTVKPSSDDGDPYPDWVRQDAKDINAAADEFVAAYDKMILLGRQRLDMTAQAPGP